MIINHFFKILFFFLIYFLVGSLCVLFVSMFGAPESGEWLLGGVAAAESMEQRAKRERRGFMAGDWTTEYTEDSERKNHREAENTNLNQSKSSRNLRIVLLVLNLQNRPVDDDFFVERKLYPNVDFYSGIIYQALGFPVAMFPVLFAIPRTAGWLAQWNEMLMDGDQRIARPRQVFEGYDLRDYAPLAGR